MLIAADDTMFNFAKSTLLGKATSPIPNIVDRIQTAPSRADRVQELGRLREELTQNIGDREVSEIR